MTQSSLGFNSVLLAVGLRPHGGDKAGGKETD